ncbi:MAG: helix-turn-helix domain-containing protein [Acidobacteria bacterium]|nr:helix-turn-helix domain-containing protein [Acidobacteriota bacterium]
MVNAGKALVQVRRRAGLTQRGLAARAGVPQSTIGRIEAGLVDPRQSTLATLLRVCGWDLEVLPRLGEGIDRTQIRERLLLTPRQRIEDAAFAAEQMRRIRNRARAG